MRDQPPKWHKFRGDYFKDLNAYHLKDDFQKAEELAYEVTPACVDEFQRKLRSIWQYNDYRLKSIVEPAIKQLRVDLNDELEPTNLDPDDMDLTFDTEMKDYFLKEGDQWTEKFAYNVTSAFIDKLERDLCRLWQHNDYRLKSIVEPAIKQLRANLNYE